MRTGKVETGTGKGEGREEIGKGGKMRKGVCMVLPRGRKGKYKKEEVEVMCVNGVGKVRI